MTLLTTLRLDRLSLRNFRCFAACEIKLHPQLTVLVAENGHGKTALLDAIATALGLLVDTVSTMRQYPGFLAKDVRLVRGGNDSMTPVLPTEFVADGCILGQPVHWTRACNGVGPHTRTTTRNAAELVRAAEELRARVMGNAADQGATAPLLPLVAFYGTERLWSERWLTEAKRSYDPRRIGRMSGYLDCLSSSSSIRGAIEWYEAKMTEAGDQRFASERPGALVSAVETAMRVVLKPTGWASLDWDFERKRLIVEHPDQGRLPLTALSDGVRTTVALAIDIARRCAILNPHLGVDAARKTPGVLLIDEVDMHLHPGWQQQVVKLLRQAFPEMQMVLSTHSPHVLSTVDRESIRIIRLSDGQGRMETPGFQTRGVESADVLAAIMGVDPIPHVPEAQWLSDYRALVETGRYETDTGKGLWDNLLKHFGRDHPAISELETLRRLQEFKRAHNLSQGEEAKHAQD